jgi:predicted house-cleaning noncanonical NTP pyrophosphatase (MazG superfamily)
MGTLRSKLVRDKVPALLRAQGSPRLHEVSRLADREYLEALADKLVEEAGEFFEAPFSLDELADVLEVVQALAQLLASPERLEEVRRAKAESRGGFDGRVWMTWEAE